MADAVQATVERMLPQLEELRGRGIFTLPEVRAIIARRKEFEYLLRRRGTRKPDFLRYLKYEMDLEGLRKLRRRRIIREKGELKMEACDASIVKNIHQIFSRATYRFPADVNLWLQHIDFSSKVGSTKSLGQLFAKALQLHPRNAGLWIKAASYECFECGNTSAARVLMQRALRLNPTTPKLWHQYFKLEWAYVHKLVGRRDVLKLGGGGADRKATAEAIEGISTLPLDEHGDEGEGASSSAVALTDGKQQLDVYGGAVPWAIFCKACEVELPGSAAATATGAAEPSSASWSSSRKKKRSSSSHAFHQTASAATAITAAGDAALRAVQFRAGFLDICGQFPAALTARVEKRILDSLQKDFPHFAPAWEVRANWAESREGGGGGGGGGAEVWEEALREEVVRTDPTAWRGYAETLQRDLLATRRGGGGDHEEEEGGGEEQEEGDDDGGDDEEEQGREEQRARSAAAKLVSVLDRAIDAVVTPATGAVSPSAVDAAATASAGGDGDGPDDAESAASLAESARVWLVLTRATLALRLGQPQDALRVLERATCTTNASTSSSSKRGGSGSRSSLCSRSCEVWLWRVATLRRHQAVQAAAAASSTGTGGAPEEGGRGEVEKVLREGLCAVGRSTDPLYPTLWQELIDLAIVSSSTTSTSTSRDRTKGITDGYQRVSGAFKSAIAALNSVDSGAPHAEAAAQLGCDFLRWRAAQAVGDTAGGGGRGGRMSAAVHGLEELRSRGLLGPHPAFSAVYLTAVQMLEAAASSSRTMATMLKCCPENHQHAQKQQQQQQQRRQQEEEEEDGGGGSNKKRKKRKREKRDEGSPADAAQDASERGRKRVRAVLEEGCARFGAEEPLLWSRYVDFEISAGEMGRANAVRWRSKQQQQQG